MNGESASYDANQALADLPPSDEALMALIQAGDSEAFEQLYDRYSPALYPLCLRILHKPCDAQTVLLDVFWELWRNREKFNPDRGTVRSYLKTLTRSRSIDHVRASGRHEAHHQQARAERIGVLRQQQSGSEPDRLAIAAEDGERLHEALETLSHAQRKSLQLAYFDGLTHQEISDLTDTPLGSVKTHIRQGLIKLRATLNRKSRGGAG